MYNRYGKLILFIVGVFILYFPLFLKLDYLPFRMWDESRPAIHAYEMFHSHNYLVATTDGFPDMWYSKPPLVTWLQVVCIRLCGYNELAIRLPTALFALATCLLLVHFLTKQTRSLLFGWVTAIVLVTLDGYVNIHGSRTGDVDVPLAFFLLCCAISLFNYIQKSKNKYLYIFFLSMAGAVFTKGVAGLFFAPAFLLYFIFSKKLIATIKNPHLYFSFLFFLLPVLGFYLLRESYNPGYLKAVWHNEWMGRYVNTVEGHAQGFGYYLQRFYEINFPLWVYLFPVGFLIGLFHPNKNKRNIAAFFSLVLGQYFLLISFSETKTPWYDIPLYPLYAVFIAFGIDAVYSAISTKRTGIFLGYLFLFIVLVMPYQYTYKRISRPGEPEVWDEKEYSLSYYLQAAIKNNSRNLDGYYICNAGYEGHLMPYLKLLTEKDQHLQFVEPIFLKAGDHVLAHQEIMKAEIEKRYTYEIVDTFRYVKLYHIQHAR